MVIRFLLARCEWYLHLSEQYTLVLRIGVYTLPHVLHFFSGSAMLTEVLAFDATMATSQDQEWSLGWK